MSKEDCHAKLGCMVLRLFPKVMQTILKHYVNPPWLKRTYLKNDFRFLFTDTEIILMEKLPNMDEFTIDICYKILRFEKMLDEPKCNWGNVPHDTEVKIADDIQRLLNATHSIMKISSEDVTELYAKKLLEEIKLFVTRIDSYLEQDTLGSMYNSLCRSETDFISILQDLTRVKPIEESFTNTESEKREMFSRLSIPIVETFPKILRDVIRQNTPAQLMYQKCVPVLNTFYPEQRKNIEDLQFSNTYGSLDVTLICKLIREFSSITTPTKGWGKLPDKVDINLGDDVERIRGYRNNLSHRSDTKVDTKEFNEYFEEFRCIGYRMDQNLLQSKNYEQEIYGFRTCRMDTAMQKKYENAMKEIENIKLRFEKRPIKFYWGDDFDTWMTNLRSLLRDEKLEGRQKVRVQIIFQKADDVENNIEVLNSLTEEINDGLSGVEFIVAKKGSLVLIVDILLGMMETDDKLLTTLSLFLEKILARITTVTSETIDIVLLPVGESTQWNKPKTIGEQVYLEFDIEAQLLETDEKVVEQLTKISDAILQHSNGSGTNQNITATLLPIDLESISTQELSASAQTLVQNISTKEVPTSAQAAVDVTIKMTSMEYDRCAKCNMVVMELFPMIMQDVMVHTGKTAKSLYHAILRNVHFRSRLNKSEFCMVETLQTDEYTKIDVRLSYKLIINFFQSIPPPSRYWGATPTDTQIGIGDDIERIRQAHDNFVHRVNDYIPEPVFDNLFVTFIDVGKRIDSFLNKPPHNGYAKTVRQYKSCVDPEPAKKLLAARADIEQLKEKYRFDIERPVKDIHIFARNSTEAAIKTMKAKEDLKESYTPCKIIISGVAESRDVVKLLNSLEDINSINSESIIFKGAMEGSIILLIDVKNRLVLDDAIFQSEVSTFLQKLFKLCDLTCYFRTQIHAVISRA